MAFIFGSLLGSFANVVIYRMPVGLSIVMPWSHCPKCNNPLSWYEKIPIISYFMLRGKCSRCKQRISLKYPLVEILVGIIAVLLLPMYSPDLYDLNNLQSIYRSYFLTPRTDMLWSLFSLKGILLYLFYLSTAVVFIVIFLIDLYHQIIPNEINGYLGITFFIYALFLFPLNHWLIGGLFGFFFPLTVSWIFFKTRKKIGLGGGDIKLFGVLGLILGPLRLIQNIFLSCLLGSIIGLLLIIIRRNRFGIPIPFGPFIIIVSSLQIYFPKYLQKFMHLIWT